MEKRAFNESVVIPIMHQTNLRTYLTQKYTSTLPNLINMHYNIKKKSGLCNMSFLIKQLGKTNHNIATFKIV